jgi:hypothetical protein
MKFKRERVQEVVLLEMKSVENYWLLACTLACRCWGRVERIGMCKKPLVQGVKHIG